MAIGKTFIQILGPNEQFPNNPGFPTIFLQKQTDVNRSVFGFSDGQGNTFSSFLVLEKGPGPGNKLSKIFDVSIDNPSSGQTLAFNASTQKWSNTSLVVREIMADADKTFSAGTIQVALTSLLTASRVLTLPAANSFPSGTTITFIDEAAGISSTNMVSAITVGADTINGSSSPFVLYSPNVQLFLTTNGNTKWTGGIISSPSDGTYQNWIPTFSGFSSDPTSITARYFTIGKMCSCYINSVAGTSNATTFTITLPIPASTNSIQTFKMRGTNAGGSADDCILRTIVGSTTANVYTNGNLSGWTASGNKNAIGSITYETI